jgi:DNA-binding LytR/AlgR family response regulator
MVIAICDDNLKCIKELESRIRDYFITHKAMLKNAEIYSFPSGAVLLESFAQRKYDIIFLDIDMPELTGMELSARIRLMDKQVQITFVTYMEDQLPFGYRVKASGFVIKPFTQARINSVMDDMMAWIEAGNKPPLEVKLKGGGVTWIETREIIIFESHRHYIEAIGTDGSRFEFPGILSSLEIELAEHDFGRLHRSYLVNLAYVFIRNANSVRLASGQEFPIGRSYSKRFISLYENYRKKNDL